MDIDIQFGPGNSAAKVLLAPAETVVAEGGAMIAMSNDVSIQTTTKNRQGGLLKAAKRLLMGESFFLNHFTAGSKGGEVWFATTLPGDMMTYDLRGETLIVQSGSYVASTPEVDFDLGWQGLKSLFSGESMFWIKLTGHGQVLLSSFGAIYPIAVNRKTIVDTGHIVAFDETLDFAITKVGHSWLQSMLSGEGFVCQFTGRGTVWCQSHNAHAFGSALGSNLRPR